MNRVKTPDVSVVIIVGPAAGPHLDACIRSVRASRGISYEIILVINAIKRGLPSWKRRFSDCRIEFTGANLGVTAYNVGIQKSRSNAILLLDEDCEVEVYTLARLYKRMVSAHAVGAVAANVWNEGSKRRFYITIPTGPQGLFTFPGGATMVNKQAMRDIGGFDETFFLWLHEDDVAIRMMEKNYKIVFAPDAQVRHHDVESVFRPRQAQYIFRNKAWFNVKHFSLVLFPLLMLRDSVWIVLYSWQKQTLAALWHAVLGYCRGYAQGNVAMRVRQTVSWRIQLLWVRFYLLYRNG
jgi:GT2 family glycosyltransferase